jgi:signal transduction histidine kinase
MMRDTPMGIRLLAVLCVPLAGLLGFGVVLLSSGAEEVRRAQNAQAVVTVLPALRDVSEALAAEAVAALEGGDAYTAAISATDEAIADSQRKYTEVKDLVGDEVADRVAAMTQAGPKARAELREASMGEQLRPVDEIAAYQAAIGQFAELPDLLAQQLTDRTVAREMTMAARSMMFQGAATIEAGVAGDAAVDEAEALSPDVRAALLQSDTGLVTAGAGLTAAPYDPAVHREFRTQLASGSTLSPAFVLEPSAVFGAEAARAQAVMEDLAGDLVRSTDEAVSEAEKDLRMTVGIVAVGVLASLVALFFATRSIVRPLTRLARGATGLRSDLAEIVTRAQSSSLPDDASLLGGAVSARAPVEVRQLSLAIRELLTSLVDTAAERGRALSGTRDAVAAIARREGALVGRQLLLLEEYERDEPDPVYLARLFELDHLASLLRRNSTSLLILTGNDRVNPHSPSMTITDVIRSAVSTISDYRRVTLRIWDDVMVVGYAATPLAQLVAELVDNAAKFSPPSEPVFVEAAATGDGMRVSIVDSGIGMNDEQLARAREQVAEPHEQLGDLDHLGLAVVARIGSRLGAVVAFDRAPERGTVVTVDVSQRLLSLAPSASDGEVGWRGAEPRRRVRHDPSRSAPSTSTSGAARGDEVAFRARHIDLGQI